MIEPLGLERDVPLAPFTTLKIGGPARFFLPVSSEDELADAVKYAGENGLDIFVLGGGSNIVVSDKGFDGLVIFVELKGVEIDGVTVTAKAGENWDDLVKLCVDNGLQGVECMSGIPGFVGGTPVQNVGAYGQEVSDTITSVRAFDRKNEKFVDLSNDECGFSYRKSIFNTTQKARYIVTSVTYELNKNAQPNIIYRDLAKYFDGRNPTIAQVRDAVIEIRRAKSMVIDDNDPNSQSAGSFFKNPIVSNERYAEILKTSGFESIPVFKVDEENVKIPAAWLIENSGFAKGFKMGNVGISSKHSLALVNLGGATLDELFALKSRIIETVSERFEIILEQEPEIV